MIIREYAGSDKNRILELLRLNTPEFFSPNEEKDLSYYLDNEADNYFVLVMEGKIVGCGGFNLTEDGKTAKISWDIFDPGYQGKGLGSALTRFRIEKIKENKQVKTLSVRTSQLVYPFYEKFGLRLREVVKDFWDEGFDLYQLDCDIESV
ncbi:GNAT family N-acetyltransferase [Flavobacterium sp. 38-13]|jgi:ribosomal protein S18 acetylase RimI-like enzyme|uniref:GNAT family N-acetyltransferase n=1 Tax=Flavobacterium sp. 38-13 TaxID=1896168 RepID=UPI0009677069|nr:GNAT family N-acetyltransferase [Flavobacterium sp. 38-13]OJX53509.1 MAG: GNAT family N-acetyltransferase [Flavobacterium sp. 38-13]THD30353.1 MAG: GNAT family N-acetyltransferase [Flavobacterium johnsoniae]